MWRAERIGGSRGRGAILRLFVDGGEVTAFAGETVATALLTAGVRSFGDAGGRRRPRGLFCGMGVCFECLVTVDSRPNVRACVTAAADGMRVTTGRT
jgi:predicted molibdopterin-dependent oxidoreductase YjgC